MSDEGPLIRPFGPPSPPVGEGGETPRWRSVLVGEVTKGGEAFVGGGVGGEEFDEGVAAACVGGEGFDDEEVVLGGVGLLQRDASCWGLLSVRHQ